ncbi:hypothetical protein HB770_21085 [Rhizobium leguminosarum bv. viciae]|uniref:Restriction alleviation protein, Lar family n=1 Tax=Rhizobium leguminosarum bv. viciae TaxID=387 RepID=A0A7G6RL66_RHILV|nr:hypothetical protein HB770_21085 [Rhizobium leguminosarum bv. viciae]
MSEHYRNCPFCGAEEGKPEDGGPLTLARDDNALIKPWSIDCLSCGAQGPRADDMMGAVDLWNNRAND